MNHRAWDIAIQANGIYELSIVEIKRVIELENQGYYVHYVTLDEFEHIEESLHPIMRYADEKLLEANRQGRNFVQFKELHNNLYIPKHCMKGILEMFFGVR